MKFCFAHWQNLQSKCPISVLVERYLKILDDMTMVRIYVKTSTSTINVANHRAKGGWLQWVSLRWVNLRWVSLRWVSLRWVSLRWVSLRIIKMVGKSPVGKSPVGKSPVTLKMFTSPIYFYTEMFHIIIHQYYALPIIMPLFLSFYYKLTHSH